MLRIDIEDKEMEQVGLDVGGGDIYHYQGQPFTGMLIEYHKNGILLLERQFVDGYVEGIIREYYNTGQVYSEGFTKRNIDYGYYRVWDENGILTFEADFGPEPK